MIKNNYIWDIKIIWFSESDNISFKYKYWKSIIKGVIRGKIYFMNIE